MGTSGDPSSQSTPIRWKEGFDLAAKAAQRAAAAAARSGRKRPLENRSFFSWFCDNGDPSADDIAEVIKDDMWYVDTWLSVRNLDCVILVIAAINCHSY